MQSQSGNGPGQAGRPGGWVLTAGQARALDRLAIDGLGLPGLVLMENAALGAADLIAEALRSERGVAVRGARVSVLCGAGNNGGDGYAVARHLHNRGAVVRVCASEPPRDSATDAVVNERVCRSLGIQVEPWSDALLGELRQADAVVDALLGTGFVGPLRVDLAERIDAVNAIGAWVAALDVPSGLDADTGQAQPTAVRAALTATFAAVKTGFAKPGADAYLGRVAVASIGVPESLVERAMREG
ncbi:MAG: NAD(P)H-hydrate epimerase [Planctomycetota bacterium]